MHILHTCMHVCFKYPIITICYAHVCIQISKAEGRNQEEKTAEDTIIARVLPRRQRTYSETPEVSETKLQWERGFKRQLERERGRQCANGRGTVNKGEG